MRFSGKWLASTWLFPALSYSFARGFVRVGRSFAFSHSRTPILTASIARYVVAAFQTTVARARTPHRNHSVCAAKKASDGSELERGSPIERYSSAFASHLKYT
jgi:hypothetical protein